MDILRHVNQPFGVEILTLVVVMVEVIDLDVDVVFVVPVINVEFKSIPVIFPIRTLFIWNMAKQA